MNKFERAKLLREALVNQLPQYKDNEVAVFLSGGADSQSVLFACLEANVKPVCFSFTLDTEESRDFKCAKAIAKHFGLKFIKVSIPSDLDTMKSTLLHIIKKFDLKKKTDIECLYIIKFALEKAAAHGIHVVLTGHSADTFYGPSTRSKNYRDGKEHLFHKKIKTDPYWSQFTYLKQMCYELDLTYDPLYHHPKVAKSFENTTFKEANNPGGKFITKEAFRDYFTKVQGYTYKHENYQAGETPFPKAFEALLESDWNIENHKALIGIYNHIIEGRITSI